VGEGGNLGLTQAGRVEYALHGGRLNTDAIDNAGGVHSSDREVNIKIPLNRLLIEGGLTREERDPLLFSMTGDIVRMVLHDNYVQPACISLEEAEAVSRLEQHVGLIRLLERSGLLNAAIEGLPDADEIAARRTAGRGLTRPELAVLVAYSKIALFDAAVASEVPDDPHLTRYLLDYFPPALVERYRGELEQHRLRREILSTILANAVVNRMGVSFALGLAEDRGAAPAEVLRAYVTAHEIFDGDRYWMAIESLDNRVPAALQYELLRRPIGLLKHATAWLVGNPQPGDMRTLVTRYREAVAAVEAQMPELLPPSYRRAWDDHYAATSGAGVPEDVARRLASSRALGSSLDIVELMHEAAVPLELASAAYYAVGELFQAPWLLGAITGLQLNGKWQQLARVDLRDDAYILLRQITAEVLRACDGDAEARLNTWRAQHHAQVDFALARLRELRSGDLADFPALVVAVRELGKLRALQGGHPHGRPTDRQEFNFAGA
jgi:glutamate dehydrogenase